MVLLGRQACATDTAWEGGTMMPSMASNLMAALLPAEASALPCIVMVTLPSVWLYSPAPATEASPAREALVQADSTSCLITHNSC